MRDGRTQIKWQTTVMILLCGAVVGVVGPSFAAWVLGVAGGVLLLTPPRYFRATSDSTEQVHIEATFTRDIGPDRTPT